MKKSIKPVALSLATHTVRALSAGELDRTGGAYPGESILDECIPLTTKASYAYATHCYCQTHLC